MLHVKKLRPDAITPTVAHPGEDLGYDLYAVEDVVLHPWGKPVKILTGIAANFIDTTAKPYTRYGLLMRDRSSMAANGLFVVGGVIDATYTGELVVMMRLLGVVEFAIKAGMKIAQMIPLPVLTRAAVQIVDELDGAGRGVAGFGSTGV